MCVCVCSGGGVFPTVSVCCVSPLRVLCSLLLVCSFSGASVLLCRDSLPVCSICLFCCVATLRALLRICVWTPYRVLCRVDHVCSACLCRALCLSAGPLRCKRRTLVCFWCASPVRAVPGLSGQRVPAPPHLPAVCPAG